MSIIYIVLLHHSQNHPNLECLEVYTRLLCLHICRLHSHSGGSPTELVIYQHEDTHILKLYKILKLYRKSIAFLMMYFIWFSCLLVSTKCTKIISKVEQYFDGNHYQWIHVSCVFFYTNIDGSVTFCSMT